MNQRLSQVLLICLALIVANCVLQWLVDDNLGIGWPHNTVRNWEEFGLGTLKGKLVTNPGGHDAVEHPDVYPGHRAVSLYPAFLLEKPFASLGFGALPFHILFTVFILGGIYFLLGKTGAAFGVGVMAILSPGYILWPTVLDPNTTALLFGIPYAAYMFRVLQKPKMDPTDFVGLLLATIVFTLVNWTTALVHMQIFLCLFITRAVPWRRLWTYAAVGIAAGAVVVLTSVASKMSENGHETGSLMKMLAGYTLGTSGYNIFGLSTATLFVRVSFVNILALFPLWILWAWILYKQTKTDPKVARLGLVPVIVAGIQVAAMRNYFAHHPWMDAPVFLLGIMISLFTVEIQNRFTTLDILWLQNPRQYVTWFASFVFGLIVLFFYREHQMSTISLVSLVRSHTKRADEILIVRQLDPVTAEVACRLDEILDRRVCVSNTQPNAGTLFPETYLLSAVKTNTGWPLIAETAPDPLESLPLVQPALNWYSKKVARRAPGDRMELADTYYLYRASTKPIADPSRRPAPK